MKRKEIERKILLSKAYVIDDMTVYKLSDYIGIVINGMEYLFSDITYLSSSKYGIFMTKNGRPFSIPIDEINSISMIEG